MQDFFARTAGVLGLTLAFSFAGCKSAPPAQPAQIIDGSANTNGDPADANLASAGPSTASGSYAAGTTQTSRQGRVPEGRVLAERSAAGPGQSSGEEYPQSQSAQTQATAPDAYGTYPPDAYNNQVDAGQAALEADQPPPPLPVYEQPMATEANDQWTPGYWDYANQGYYWVPGAWVAPPYIGALWTPGYWGYERNRYGFHHGFWGRHIGFYGGIPYGFGYTGYGYQGGYWNGSEFYYNRAVNRVDSRVVRNVYVHNVTIINNNNNHVSYNGGNGGIPVRPRPQELAALRESRLPPMQTQLQVARSSATDPRQFFAANHGAPAVAAANERFPADHGITAPPERGPQNIEAMHAGAQGTLRQAPEVSLQRPNQTSQQQQLHPQPGQPQNSPQAAARPQTTLHPQTPSTPPSAVSRPSQPARVQNAPVHNAPVQPQTESQSRSQPAHPAQPQTAPGQTQTRPQAGSQPQRQIQTRPAATPQPQSRPQPQTRPEQSAPQSQLQARPQPTATPQPQSRPQPQMRPEQTTPQPQTQPRSQPSTEQRQAVPEATPHPQVQPPHPQPQAQPRAQPQPRPAAPAPHAEEHPR